MACRRYTTGVWDEGAGLDVFWHLVKLTMSVHVKMTASTVQNIYEMAQMDCVHHSLRNSNRRTAAGNRTILSEVAYVHMADFGS